MPASLEQARAAFEARAWTEARDGFVAAGQLDAADAERLAVAAYLVGDEARCDQGWESAYRAALDAGRPDEAARLACWLALVLALRGQHGMAGGWFGRAGELVADVGDCAAAGLLHVPALLGALGAGDGAAARDHAIQAIELGTRFGDADLRTLGVLGHGQALVALGDAAGGTARLDEAMVAVATGEVGPVVTGIVYCAAIIEFLGLHDLARATEWTAVLGAWCDAQADLVPYRGQCLVHRSQIHQAAGRWPDAVAAVADACRQLTDPPHPALGMAHYQQGELHRLRGELDAAEVDYRLASRHGHHPMPGLALLQLARGDATGAATTIGGALREEATPATRPALLAAAVDILGAVGDVAGGRAAADELGAIASASSSPLLAAVAAHAHGTVLVAEGDVARALTVLRDAAHRWRALQLPYEGARTAAVLGAAYDALGDRTAAALELDNARAALAALGAVPDLARLDGSAPDDGLSAREHEVLVHLAAGKSNREIADALVISAHTVGRHVEHIFTKLGVSSRAAATAYAYEHGLLTR
jgi:DNA-binding CsgD family transcriptional regulator